MIIKIIKHSQIIKFLIFIIFLLFNILINVSCKTSSSQYKIQKSTVQSTVNQKSTIKEKLKDIKISFLQEIIIPNKEKLNNALIGGLSGIYYDKKEKKLLVISDDKGEFAPPRWLEFKVNFNINNLNSSKKKKKIIELVPIKNVYLTTPKTTPENQKNHARIKILDNEGISKSKDDIVIISSEGYKKKSYPIIPASINFYDLNGNLILNFTLPDKFWDHNKKPSYGIRGNFKIGKTWSIESLSLSNDQKYLYTATEKSLVQDGNESNFKKNSLIRIIQYDYNKIINEHIIKNKSQKFSQKHPIFIKNPPQPLHEWAYNLSKIPCNKNDNQINECQKNLNQDFEHGLVDLLHIRNNYFFTLERTFIYATKKHYVNLFLVDCSNAKDIKSFFSLKNKKIKTCKKNHILDLAKFNNKLKYKRLDNIEGMALGPKISNQEQLLFFISDNNFNKYGKQISQIIILKINSNL